MDLLIMKKPAVLVPETHDLSEEDEEVMEEEEESLISHTFKSLRHAANLFFPVHKHLRN